jgi:hypothetical protein
MGASHAPVIASSRSLYGLSQRGADHHSVGATGECFAKVSAGANASVCDNGDVPSGSSVILLAGRCAIEGRCDLRNADAGNFAGRTGRSGADANQNSVDSRFHQLQRDTI